MNVTLNLSHLRWADRFRVCWAILRGKTFVLGGMAVNPTGPTPSKGQLQ